MDRDAILRAFQGLYTGQLPGRDGADGGLMGGAPKVFEPPNDEDSFVVVEGGDYAHAADVNKDGSGEFKAPFTDNGIAPQPTPGATPVRETSGTGLKEGQRLSITTRERPAAPEVKPWAAAAPSTAPTPRPKGLDDDMLLAYAQLGDDQFRHAIGRAGNRIGQAFAGGKVDNGAYDKADAASREQTVGRANALLEREKKKQALEAGELKLGRAQEEGRIDSPLTRVAQSIAKSMFPEAKPEMFDNMTYLDIAKALGEAKPMFDAKVRFQVAAMGGGASTTLTTANESASTKKFADAAEANSKTGQRRAQTQLEQTVAVGYQDAEGNQGRANNRYVTDFNQRQSDYRVLARISDKLLTTYNQSGGPQAWPNVDKVKMQGDVRFLHQYLNKAFANGVMNKEDQVAMDAILPDFNEFKAFFFTDLGPARVQNMVENIALRLEEDRKTAGWTPVTAADTRPGGGDDPAKRPQQLGQGPAKAPPAQAGAKPKDPPGMVLIQRPGNIDPAQMKPFAPEKAAEFLQQADPATGKPKYEKVNP